MFDTRRGFGKMGRFRKARVATSAGVLIAGMWGTSMALFTDSNSSASGTFTAGTVDITSSDVTSTLTASNMAPGDKVTAPLTVANAGSLDLRYAMTTTASGPLAGDLVAVFKTGVSDCSNAGFDATGSTVASGGIGALAFGSSAPGAQAGDRELAPGASDVFCVQVSLPTGTANAAQGQSGSATFTFDAEQVRNNP